MSVDLRKMLGQMVTVGFEGPQPTPELLSAIRTHKLGNISFYAHNFTGREAACELTSGLREHIVQHTGMPPFFFVDQEGGMVTRLKQGFTQFPGAMTVAATGNADYAFELGFGTGLEALSAGLNVVNAPVVDINTNPRNPVIGVRSYGDTAEQVQRFSMRMYEGLRESGVLPVLKHFPGHGDTETDSHFDLPVVRKSLDQLRSCELKPYVEGIRRGAAAIMTSHILFPLIDDSGLPATMSPTFLQGILRDELHFEGIIRTDDLDMHAISQKYGIVDGAIAAIRASADIVCISRSLHLAVALIERLEKEVAEGSLPLSIIESAFSRISATKHRVLRQPQDGAPAVDYDKHERLANAIREESIALYRDPRGQVPVTGRVLVVATPPYNRTNIVDNVPEPGAADLLSKALTGTGLAISVRPDKPEREEVLSRAQCFDTVVLCTYNAHLHQEQLDLAYELSESHRNVVFVALRNPYDLPLLPPGCASLAAYEYTEGMLKVLGEVLAGRRRAKGRIQVALSQSENQ